MDQVSRVVCFCDDKRVGAVLRALAGLVHEKPTVEPVVNVNVKGGKLEPATNGRLLSMFVDWLRKKKIKKLTHTDLKTFVTSVGRVESAYVGLRKDAQALGVIKKTGSGKNAYYMVAGGLHKLKNKQKKAR